MCSNSVCINANHLVTIVTYERRVASVLTFPDQLESEKNQNRGGFYSAEAVPKGNDVFSYFNVMWSLFLTGGQVAVLTNNARDDFFRMSSSEKNQHDLDFAEAVMFIVLGNFIRNSRGFLLGSTILKSDGSYSGHWVHHLQVTE